MAIIPASDRDFDITIPVCIVGGGACGLTAAISAAQAGAEVAVFESDTSPAGSTAMTIGLICAAGTKLQEQAGIKDNAALLFEDILRATRGQTDEDHARFLAEQSGATIDWLCEDAGCDLRLEKNWSGYGHSQLRCHGTPNCTGEELIAMLLAAARDANATILTSTTVRDLIVDEAQKVVGLVCETPNGDMTVGCNALILASSGFGANQELVSRYIPKMEKAQYHGCENHRGDAVLWGQALGAELADMGSYQGVGTHTPFGFGLPHSIMIDGGFKVGKDGKRFENELENLSQQAIALLSQPDACGWIVYDRKGHEKAASLFGEYGDNAAMLVEACEGEDICSLAAKAKINPKGLEETFAEVTRWCESSGTDPFGRTFRPEQRLEPSYMAVKVTGAMYHTQGGLCIDHQARVRRKYGGVFPNLFAGGGAARSVSGPAEWGYLPAIGLSTAVTFGRVAGREAAKQVLSASAGMQV